MNNITHVSDSLMCSTCGACAAIAVVGLPCQMKAITAMQALKKFGNVRYKISLVCEGVLGMTAQDALISFSNPKLSDNQKIDWKRKTVPTTSGGVSFSSYSNLQ